tara:strand:- start:113 stop:376 length:264 start_codon:yes stop_codon:yes gene_type:complete
MKSFILKSAIIFIFCLLLFRFTIVSLVNEYENKINSHISSSHIEQIKKEFFQSIKENNEKDNILDPEDAELLSIFIKKILNELNIRQ